MNPKQKTALNRLLYILIFFVGIIIGVGAFDRLFMPLVIHGKGGAEIPDVVGIPEEQARNLAERKGFDFKVLRSEHSDSIPEGQVISQRPEAGSKAKKGRRISVVTSLSVKIAEVPDVKNIHFRTAQIQIEKQGLKVGDISYESSDSFKSEFVISTTPEAGDSLPLGSKVNMLVSAGSDTGLVKVPNFTGQLIDDAEELGRREGIYVIGRYRKIPSVPANTIYSQGTAPGTLVKRGNVVYVVVARGE
jgi:serine/threonine-protein kinase